MSPAMKGWLACDVCGGSGVEEVYGGHGTVLEVECTKMSMTDAEIIAAMARAMGEADHVWFWKTGGDGENAQQHTARMYYEAAARRQLAAHRKMLELTKPEK